MAPGAVTHANDMSQRHVPLAATVQPAGTLSVSAPAVPELAPPTYYMLFVLNDAGVPSVAKFIRLKLGRADLPPAQEPPPDTTAPETSIASGLSQTTTSTSATFSGSIGPSRTPDSIPPTLSVLGKAVDKRRVLLDVGCPTEACTATAAGRVVVPGAARAFGLPATSANIQKGYSARLKLQLSGKAWRVARRALSARRKVRVRVQLTARDAAGNVAATKRSIRLKQP